MHRFFANKENILSDSVILHGSDASHIRTVLRLQVGDKIQVLDGEGSLYLVQLVEVKNNSIKGEIISQKKLITNRH